MPKRYQIKHYFKNWISAESFNTLSGAINFAKRVFKANKNMKKVKVVDRSNGKTKFLMDRRDK